MVINNKERKYTISRLNIKLGGITKQVDNRRVFGESAFLNQNVICCMTEAITKIYVNPTFNKQLQNFEKIVPIVMVTKNCK